MSHKLRLEYLIDFTHKNPSYLVPISSFGPDTPNIYGNWLAGNSAAVGRRLNFYNTSDFALSPDAWCFDQELKPDISCMQNGTNWNYAYNGSTNDPAPWNNFIRWTLLPFGPVLTNTFDIVNSLTDCYEVMAYAAEARSRPLGSTPNISGLTGNLDLTTLWPPDTSGHGYADHFWHSAQFRGDPWQQWSFWDTLLHSSRSGFNLSSP